MWEVSAALEQDAILMLRVKEGDGQSFELLLQKYRLPLVNYLHRMIQNQPIAEELSQEVFLRVYRARGSYEPTAKFTTWLFRIATHLALELDSGSPQRAQSPQYRGRVRGPAADRAGGSSLQPRAGKC